MSTARPEKKDGSKLCLAITREGVTAYGNRAAFESLAEWLKWIASSVPSERFECHTVFSLQDDSLFDAKANKNVCRLFNEDTERIFNKMAKEEFGFELTFMMSSESELDQLLALEATGRLPENWNRGQE
jgi:hypothetical protein